MYVQISFDRQIYIKKYVSTSICKHVWTSIDKKKKVETSIEWTRTEQNRQAHNSIGKSRDNNIEYIMEKSMKECLYRNFNRKKKEKERQILN